MQFVLWLPDISFTMMSFWPVSVIIKDGSSCFLISR